jgi:hypothetical protein
VAPAWPRGGRFIVYAGLGVFGAGEDGGQAEGGWHDSVRLLL